MMTTPQKELGPAYQACLNEAFRQCPVLMARWCTRLADALDMRSMTISEAAEKQALQNAFTALKKHRAFLEQGFAGELIELMAHDTQGRVAKKSEGPRPLSSVRFDELELMGDGQVQEAVDSARLRQTVLLACEAGLAGFSARMSSAQGFKMVRPDKNPLRPEMMSQALLNLLQHSPADLGARTRWLTHGGRLMGDALQSLYIALDDLLAGQGIAPAAYGVMTGPGSPGEASVSPSPPSGFPLPVFTPDAHAPAAADALARRNPLLTLDHLHHFLAGDYDEVGGALARPSGMVSMPTARPDFSHTVPAAMDVLAELQQQAIDTRHAPKSRAAPALPLVQLRAQLQTEAKSLGQSLAIEVVGLMIGQIAQDSRLLAPVRQVVADAEPAFLRLALTDPRFFSDKRHPARRLLDVITSTSLAYASESAAGFAGFLQNLREVAADLTEEHAGDAQHFAALLQDFERRQTSHTREYRESQRQAVQALLQAEQRNLLAEKIAAEIRERPDFVAGNRIVTLFLTGPWAQVMAKERLRGEHGGLGATQPVFSLALGDVLWSLDVAQASRHRKRLLQMIPGMLNALREGLLSIDYPLAQSRPFFDELMDIHRVALAAPPSPPEGEGASRQRLEAAFAAGDERLQSQPWLAPSEALDSGFMDDAELHSKPGFEPTQPQRDMDGGADPAESPDPVALRLGAWIELLLDLQWRRAQLTWVSPHNTLYMFTSEGGRKHSMTSVVLQQLIGMGIVKVISQQGVLEGALDNVARTALRNSMDGQYDV